MHWTGADDQDNGVVELTQVTGVAITETGVEIQATATCLGGFAMFSNSPMLVSASAENESPLVSIQFAAFVNKSHSGALGNYVDSDPITLDWQSNLLNFEYAFGSDPAQQQSVGGSTGMARANAFGVTVGYSDMSTIQSLKVSIPLADGTTPIVDVNPSDAVLRKLIDDCQGTEGGGDGDSSSSSSSGGNDPPSPAQDAPAPSVQCLAPDGTTTSEASVAACRNSNGVVMGQ